MTTDVTALADGVRQGRRADVSRAITLVESSRADHRAAARELLKTGEAPALKSARQADLAAMTVTTRAILNLHEMITRN